MDWLLNGPLNPITGPLNPLGPLIPQILPHIPNPFSPNHEGGDHQSMPEHAPALPPPSQMTDQAGQPHQSMHDRYQAQAYARLGISEQEFNTMDPVERNTRINASYAQMYQDNPDTMKWAGMASYASEAVGTGMMQAEMLNIPGMQTITGAPSGDHLHDMFAQGNGELYQDIMWQHLAMQNGGIAELQRASKEDPTSIAPAQLQAWAEIDKGNQQLQAARASGDQAAIQAAQDAIYGGNGHLLEYEQKTFLQQHVYDHDRDAVRFLDSGWNVLGVNSPIPGGESFGEYRGRTGAGGSEDIGDPTQRWDWISHSMLPSFRDLEQNHNGDMQQDLRRMVANRDTGIPGNPLNTEHPTESPLHAPSWMPHLPDIPLLPGHGGGGGGWTDIARSLVASPLGLF